MKYGLCTNALRRKGQGNQELVSVALGVFETLEKTHSLHYSHSFKSDPLNPLSDKALGYLTTEQQGLCPKIAVNPLNLMSICLIGKLISERNSWKR